MVTSDWLPTSGKSTNLKSQEKCALTEGQSAVDISTQDGSQEGSCEGSREGHSTADGRTESDEGPSSTRSGAGVVYRSLQRHGPGSSKGSAGHPASCRPCAFYCFSFRGCRAGEGCQFCHQPHRSKLRERRENRKKTHREQRRAIADSARREPETLLELDSSANPQAPPSHMDVAEVSAPLVSTKTQRFPGSLQQEVRQHGGITPSSLRSQPSAQILQQNAQLQQQNAQLQQVAALCEVMLKQVDALRRSQVGTKPIQPQSTPQWLSAASSGLSSPEVPEHFWLGSYMGATSVSQDDPAWVRPSIPCPSRGPKATHAQLGGNAGGSHVEFFTYRPTACNIAVGQRAELWPPAHILSAGISFKATPELPLGFRLETETGIVHGVAEAPTCGPVSFFITGEEPLTGVVKVAASLQLSVHHGAIARGAQLLASGSDAATSPFCHRHVCYPPAGQWRAA